MVFNIQIDSNRIMSSKESLNQYFTLSYAEAAKGYKCPINIDLLDKDRKQLGKRSDKARIFQINQGFLEIIPSQ